MIRVHCDICGEEIAEYRSRKYLPEGDETRRRDPVQRWQTCAKCAEALRMIDIPGLVKDTVIAMRAGIPKTDKGTYRHRTMRFVP